MATVYISRGRRRRRRACVVVVLATSIVAGCTGIRVARSALPALRSTTAHEPAPLTSPVWPAEGEAAVAVGAGPARVHGGTAPVPIASLAKVMTALVVLVAHPLSDDDDAPLSLITPEDVRDTAVRRAQGQSVVSVVAGEHLTERQALEAILLPSANNIAAVVARDVGGSIAAFVDRMNDQARRLGMRSTRYTDPSGYDPGTVSTARDQLVLARAAMRIPAFAAIVGESQATLPVAGTVRNTDTLVGRDGFVGIKTGSDSAAGGCFMFAVRFTRDARRGMLWGVVLGQRHGPLIAAALGAAQQLAASALATPSSR